MSKKKKDQQPAQPSIHTPTNKEIWYSVEFELPYKVNEKELDTLFDIMAHYYREPRRKPRNSFRG